MMNSTNLIGNLTKDPELKYAGNGTAYLKGTVAVQRRFNKEEADFIQFTIFSKGAEIFAQHMKKGSKVGLEGRIQTGRYDNEQGQTVFTTDVIVDNFSFLDSKQDQAQSQGQGNQNTQGQQQSTQAGNQAQGQGAPIDISDDDLPF